MNSTSQPNELVARFLNWEQSSRDTIDFKKAYVDMAGDLIAGLVLSQIVYWHLPGRNNVTRLQISHDGEQWIAKKREEWWNEVRVTPKQLDRALKVLEKRGLIVTALYHFNSKPTKHVRINWDGFMPLFDEFSISPKVKIENPILPKGQIAISPKVKILLTESTSIDYKENTLSASPDGDPIAAQVEPMRGIEKLLDTAPEVITTPPIATQEKQPDLPQNTPPTSLTPPDAKQTPSSPGLKQPRKPRPPDPLFDAVGVFLGAKSPTDVKAMGWRIGQIINGDKRAGRCDGLLAYEKERDGGFNRPGLALEVERFATWFKNKHAELTLKDCAKFMEYWVEFRATPKPLVEGVDYTVVYNRDYEVAQ